MLHIMFLWASDMYVPLLKFIGISRKRVDDLLEFISSDYDQQVVPDI